MTKLAEFSLGASTFSVVSVGERGSEEAPSARELARFSLREGAYAIVASEPDARPPSGASASELLTGRELQIAALVARGMANKEVADRLKISEWTVCAHLRRIYSKLQVSSRAAMVFHCAELVREPSR